MSGLRLLPLVGLWLATTAGSCATTGGAPARIVEVDKPVAVSCIPPDAPGAPANPASATALEAAPDAAARYQLLAEFWALYSPVIPYQAALIEACRAAGAPTP